MNKRHKFNLCNVFFARGALLRPLAQYYAGGIWKTEVSLWKRIKCFISTRRQGNLKTQQSLVILDLYLGKTRKENIMIIATSSFLKSCVFNFSFFFFSSTSKRKAGVFKFLQFEERFRKVPFSWRISVNRRPNRRNKVPFSCVRLNDLPSYNQNQ